MTNLQFSHLERLINLLFNLHTSPLLHLYWVTEHDKKYTKVSENTLSLDNNDINLVVAERFESLMRWGAIKSQLLEAH